MKIILKAFLRNAFIGSWLAILSYDPLSAATIDVNVSDFVFTSSTVNIKIGDTVRWNWVNGSHSTTSGISGTANGQWDSGIRTPAFSFSQTFDQAGHFPYFCSVHWQSGMTGVVVVNDPNALPPKLENPIKKGLKKVMSKQKLSL